MKKEEYPIDAKNKVKRAPKRGVYDKETVYKILDDDFLCHVGFVVNEQPFVIPTTYGRIGNKVYIHGAVASRMLQNLEKGIPISITVTLVDGLVLARSAFHHSMNYRSVMLFGTAHLVEDEKEKNDALFAISENIIPNRWDEVREPNEKELKITSVLGLEIEQASAKIRTGDPSDDKKDYELPIWAGVIPLKTVAQEAIADSVLPKDIPISDSVLKYGKQE
jgi:nitroimidazol reductase NimA-like FMN-containing flavoprotein (pyridoxamine 5'-phosphate oxidase superfamily)